MSSKVLTNGLIVSVIALVLSWLVHGLILGADYAKLSNLYRPEAETNKRMPLILIAHLFMGLALVWVYMQGMTVGQPWLMQGARFGAAICAMSVIPMYLIMYSVQPLPGNLAIKQAVLDCIATIGLCIAIGYLCRAHGQA